MIGKFKRNADIEVLAPYKVSLYETKMFKKPNFQ